MAESFIVMTGLSGAGKSVGVKVLEDLGYYTLDNVPPALIPEALAVCERGGYTRVAFVIDVRSGPLFQDAVAVLDRLEREGRRPHLLFFDAADEVLLRRYSQTRHRHPLESAPSGPVGTPPHTGAPAPGAPGAGTGVASSIAEERRLLVPLRGRADKVIDTTHLTPTDLRSTLHSLYGSEKAAGMFVRLVSFGYKYGLPADADVVLDVRFMENPYYRPEFRTLPGSDPRVRDFVLGNAATKEFLEHAMGLLGFAVPRYAAERKARLTIAFGCTGGRHRSVVIADEVARCLPSVWSGDVQVEHRDVARADEAT